MTAIELILKSTCHVLIHGGNHLPFDEVWPRWGCGLLCLCIVCEWCSKLSICSISDGLRDVISHSVLVLIKWPSRHGSPTKANPSSSSAWRVTGQLERGAVTRSLLWLQLWGERSQAGDTMHRQGPNKIHLQKQTRWAGALEVMSSVRAPHPLPSIACGTCHQEQLAVIPIERAV